ncbi:hypothetical protein BCR32DRAFT_329408 [Anaeromyces robustus]|uniref:Uncharacterized protein n=1 Tax=Anaeromyces robustus TaxID=1754192 RepID=A0A1Y1WT71_9FUNG|nr:hypothetical protein BCR32DRAFT_329408 [Anaeromyces robustus]|eukprot:ORX76334.1 hypothetical protein BCR32DRAFT_329408 [Anaeromyces robustus]
MRFITLLTTAIALSFTSALPIPADGVTTTTTNNGGWTWSWNMPTTGGVTTTTTTTTGGKTTGGTTGGITTSTNNGWTTWSTQSVPRGNYFYNVFTKELTINVNGKKTTVKVEPNGIQAAVQNAINASSA